MKLVMFFCLYVMSVSYLKASQDNKSASKTEIHLLCQEKDDDTAFLMRLCLDENVLYQDYNQKFAKARSCLKTGIQLIRRMNRSYPGSRYTDRVGIAFPKLLSISIDTQDMKKKEALVALRNVVIEKLPKIKSANREDPLTKEDYEALEIEQEPFNPYDIWQ